MNLQFANIKQAVINKGYAFFENGDYNLNIIGVRASDVQSNLFNDVICVLFYVNGLPHRYAFQATTDPGVYWRQNPLNVRGTAIVMPNQYRGLWQLGLHQGKYQALVQRKPITVYRDANTNTSLEMAGQVETGFFGINAHMASATTTSQQVNKWSAGCQVLANPDDFSLLMALCNKAESLYGNNFTYTLIEEGDL
ncbi:hypothetical protein [Dasania marina]|uniref:hypothetical protein n=1 Tax=Dasania marina TaxID=471499 RepID=UPI00036EEC75|nr:hypothetical protein [Dasania marina]